MGIAPISSFDQRSRGGSHPVTSPGSSIPVSSPNPSFLRNAYRRSSPSRSAIRIIPVLIECWRISVGVTGP